MLVTGEIFVIDGSSREVRFYATDGSFLHSVGRAGEGPGEFALDPTLVSSPHYDSVMVFDARLQRFSVASPQGGAIRTYPSLTLTSTPWQVGESAFGLTAIESPVGMVGEQVLTLHSRLSITGGPGVQPQIPFEYRITQPETGASTVVTRFVRDRFVGTPLVGVLVEIPFYVAPMAGTAGDRFYIGSGESSEIQEFDSTGQLRRLIRLDEPESLVTEDLLTQVVEARLSTQGDPTVKAARRDAYRNAPTPRRVPVFRSLLVDELGWIWAESYGIETPGPPEWMVFDRDGQAHGVVEMPTDFRVYQIGADHILGVGRDERGVEYVRVYALTRD